MAKIQKLTNVGETDDCCSWCGGGPAFHWALPDTSGYVTACNDCRYVSGEDMVNEILIANTTANAKGE